MSIPVISTTTSVLGYRKGQYFEDQMQATNSPTSWAGSGLPAGMSIDATGLVSGAATAAGVYLIRFIATNGDGASAPLDVAMGIEDTNFNDGIGIEVDIDLPSGEVIVPGIAAPASATEGSPIMFLKYGDGVYLDVGFLKGDELQNLAVSGVKMNIREFDQETILVESSGTVEFIGTTDKPRYRIFVDLDDAPALLSALSGYQSDFKTSFNAIAEIEWRVDYLEPGAESAEVVRSSKTFRLAIDKDLIATP